MPQSSNVLPKLFLAGVAILNLSFAVFVFKAG
jgi:hypothetical protein